MTLHAARAVVVANLPGMYSRRDTLAIDGLARVLQRLSIAQAFGPCLATGTLLKVWQTDQMQSCDPAVLAALTRAAVSDPPALSADQLEQVRVLAYEGAV
jgi:hypothetical protein